MRWEDLQSLESRSYVCGHCGNPLASAVGYRATAFSTQGKTRYTTAAIYICHQCKNPTYLKGRVQIPGPAFGGVVEHISSEEVEALYEEARNCMKVNAHTAAVMCCRKLLMNIAVARGADEGLKFWQYVNYLSDQGFVPPDGKEWVDLIRKKGNDANHEIAVMDREDAEELLTFSEMLLRFIYEYPAKIKARVNKTKEQARQPRRMPDASK